MGRLQARPHGGPAVWAGYKPAPTVPDDTPGKKRGCPLFHRASGCRLLSKLEVGDEQQIEHVPRFVGLINDHGG